MKQPTKTSRAILLFMVVYYLWVNANHFGVTFSALSFMQENKYFLPAWDTQGLIWPFFR